MLKREMVNKNDTEKISKRFGEEKGGEENNTHSYLCWVRAYTYLAVAEDTKVLRKKGNSVLPLFVSLIFEWCLRSLQVNPPPFPVDITP